MRRSLLLASLVLAFGLLLTHASHAETPIAEGDTAPAFTLEGSAGGSYALEDLKGKKNLVLVFFRGTW